MFVLIYIPFFNYIKVTFKREEGLKTQKGNLSLIGSTVQAKYTCLSLV